MYIVKNNIHDAFAAQGRVYNYCLYDQNGNKTDSVNMTADNAGQFAKDNSLEWSSPIEIFNLRKDSECPKQ